MTHYLNFIEDDEDDIDDIEEIEEVEEEEEEEEDEDEESDDDTIDNSLVEDFLATEEGYQDFYQEPVEAVELFFLYLNQENGLVSVSKDVLILAAAGTVARDQLLTCIKRNQTQNEIKYKLKHLVRFNFDLHPLEITDFLKEPKHDPLNGAAKSTDLTTGLRFLTPEKYFDDLPFRPTISIFQDLNALYFIFQETTPPAVAAAAAGDAHLRRQTRKIRPAQKHGLTRRVKINSK